MRRMRDRYAGRNANGGVPVHRSRGWMNVFALPSYMARRLGSGRAGAAGGDAEAGGDGQGHGQVMRGASFSELTSMAPTQEEEDEEWRNMSLCKLLPW